MRYYLGVAKKREVSDAAIREALSVAMAVSAGKVRAQAREALKGLLDSIPTEESTGGCRG
jgi:alkylhydroperoxidase/carboxymuconolactone decarboxylase family protein YurZ